MTTSLDQVATTRPATRSPWRSIGVWMSLILVAYMAFAFVQALVAPTALAQSFGLTAADGRSAYVQVYAIRALFLGVYGLALILRREIRALATFILLAIGIPLGDTILVAVKGGPLVAIITNFVTALFLLATWYMLRRWIRATTARLS